MVLASTRQLRLQGSVSVHAQCTEGVTRSEEWEGANGDGNRGGGERAIASQEEGREQGQGGDRSGVGDERANERRERGRERGWKQRQLRTRERGRNRRREKER